MYDAIAELNQLSETVPIKHDGLIEYSVPASEAAQDHINSTAPIALQPTPDTSLTEFLGRSVKLPNLVISAEDTGGSLDIFALWRAIPSIKEKLSRFGYLKGTLEVTLIANGTPFQYGAILVGMRALPIDVSSSSNFFFGNTRTLLGYDANYPSIIPQIFQLPHLIIDPGATATYKLQCPLMSTVGWIPLWTTMPHRPVNFIYAASSFRQASGQPLAPLSLSMYVRLVDAEVSLPVVTAQAGSTEEKPMGVYQATATAVANAARAMQPVFPLWATPIATAASLGAKVAGALGLSRQTALEFNPVIPIDNQMAYAAGGRVQAYGVGVDPLRAVSISSKAAGYGHDDDDNLLKLASRWGMARVGTFSTTNSANETIMEFWVNPLLCENRTIAPNRNWFITPLGYVSLPFETWGGSIRYKFTFCASAFHKGSVRICYDPTGTLSALAAQTTDPSLLKTVVHTVNGVTEVEFDAPWSAPNQFMRVPALDSASHIGSTGNGKIFVICDTPLTCNGYTNGVEFFVQMCAGSDFRWGPPNIANVANYAPLMAVAQAGPLVTQVEHPHLLTYGEKIETVSQLVKRFQLGSLIRLASPATAGVDFIRETWSWWPAFFAIRGKGVLDGVPQESNTYTSWFEALFHCQRGGYRVSLSQAFTKTPITANNSNNTMVFGGGPHDVIPLQSIDYTMAGGQRIVSLNSDSPGLMGAQIFDTKITGEVYPVHHGNFRIANAGLATGTWPSTTSGTKGACYGIKVTHDRQIAIEEYYDVYYAAADDYSLSSYDITPVLQYIGNVSLNTEVLPAPPPLVRVSGDDGETVSYPLSTLPEE